MKNQNLTSRMMSWIFNGEEKMNQKDIKEISVRIKEIQKLIFHKNEDLFLDEITKLADYIERKYKFSKKQFLKDSVSRTTILG